MSGFSRHRAFASAVEVWQKQLADGPLPLPAGTGAPAALQEFVQRAFIPHCGKKTEWSIGPCTYHLTSTVPFYPGRIHPDHRDY